MHYSKLLIKIAFTIIMMTCVSIEEARSFEMFGIDIQTATRDQITNAIKTQGVKKIGVIDNLTDRYEGYHLFPGARIYVKFTIDGKLDNVIYQFDSGNWFTEVLEFNGLEKDLIEKYGKPAVPAANERNSDFDAELYWAKDGVLIQLVRFKGFVAWTLHETHRLSCDIDPSVKEAGKETFEASRLP